MLSFSTISMFSILILYLTKQRKKIAWSNIFMYEILAQKKIQNLQHGGQKVVNFIGREPTLIAI